MAQTEHRDRGEGYVLIEVFCDERLQEVRSGQQPGPQILFLAEA